MTIILAYLKLYTAVIIILIIITMLDHDGVHQAGLALSNDHSHYTHVR